MTRSIVVANSKGGCGKTTLAVHIAAGFAHQGETVLLVDHDPQRSALDWLRSRQLQTPVIQGVDAAAFAARESAAEQIIVHDFPAGCGGDALRSVLSAADFLLIPILPSAIDIKTVVRFLLELQKLDLLELPNVKIGLIANRVRLQARFYQHLMTFIERTPYPTATSLRDSQSYIAAMAEGKTLFDLPASRAGVDLKSWQQLFEWLVSNTMSKP